MVSAVPGDEPEDSFSYSYSDSKTDDSPFLYYDDTTSTPTSNSSNTTTYVIGDCDVSCMKLWLVFGGVVVIALMLVLYLCVPVAFRRRPRRRLSTWIEDGKPKKSDVTADSYKRAIEYIKTHLPSDDLPSSEKIQNNILGTKGYSAWMFVHGGHSEVTNNGRWVEFFFKSTEKNKESSIQTNYPFFTCGDVEYEEIMHYFEVTVKKVTKQVNTIAIGLTTTPYPYFRLPGYHENSVAYHSDDGRKFRSDPHGGEEYGPRWGKGDTIGCGYKPGTGEVFFTKNGENLGVAFGGVHHTWYPSIGTDGSCELEVNFGDSEFKFKDAKGFGPGNPLHIPMQLN
ncbi:13724_t:CDS:2 [Dentiscutata heterogama]|uniref:13724_t:CDS:1 n=1 Tax=Dentiscutata heterogama TaxID=1316150 RepID=A0ACA9MD26_9GLOM|nr:13724_t:CDS:2 [Dentiscutata heterogama]